MKLRRKATVLIIPQVEHQPDFCISALLWWWLCQKTMQRNHWYRAQFHISLSAVFCFGITLHTNGKGNFFNTCPKKHFLTCLKPYMGAQIIYYITETMPRNDLITEQRSMSHPLHLVRFGFTVNKCFHLQISLTETHTQKAHIIELVL